MRWLKFSELVCSLLPLELSLALPRTLLSIQVGHFLFQQNFSNPHFPSPSLDEGSFWNAPLLRSPRLSYDRARHNIVHCHSPPLDFSENQTWILICLVSVFVLSPGPVVHQNICAFPRSQVSLYHFSFLLYLLNMSNEVCSFVSSILSNSVA